MSRFTKVIIGSVILLYIWCLYVYLNTPIRTEIVKFGQLEDSENTVGYIMREEKLLYSNVVGNFDGIAKEGERVAKGSKIATVYKKNVDLKIQETIKSINERIAEINNNQVKNDIFFNDLQKLSRQVDSKIDEIINIAYTQKTAKLSQIKEDINKILEKKLIISGEKGASGHNLEALKKEKEEYENRLRASKIDLIADRAGVVSYNIDGLEQILNPENISKFTVSDFQNLDNIHLNNQVEVKPGQAVAKIINNFEWYLAFVMDTQRVYPLKVGDKLSVRFKDLEDKVIDAYIHYISPEEKGKVIVVLSLNKHIDSIYTFRKVNIDIIKQSYSGFKIPVSAVRVRNGKTGVYIIRDRIARFREIEILYKNNDFAIVKENNLNENNLLLYDEVIIKSNNIEEGKLIR
ncbi:MAG: hypothetical protein PWQ70_253 [Clostridiales bacterium]|jgi:putative membrane fusion protein|nr:hypothetical protein [Clostridiales bacterium]